MGFKFDVERAVEFLSAVGILVKVDAAPKRGRPAKAGGKKRGRPPKAAAEKVAEAPAPKTKAKPKKAKKTKDEDFE